MCDYLDFTTFGRCRLDYSVVKALQKSSNNIIIFTLSKSYIALAFGVLLFLSGCETKSAELKALENSVSIIQLTTGREVERYTRDKHAGFTGPVYPQISIVYEPINNYTKKEVYDEIVAILEKSNWQRDESNTVTVPEHFSGDLQQGDFKISGGVSIDSDKNHVIIVMTIY